MRAWIFWMIFAGYFAGWVAYFTYFETDREAFFRFGQRLLLASLAVHFIWVGHYCVTEHTSRAMLWQMTAPLVIVGLSIFMEWLYKTRFLLLFSLPMVLLLSMLVGGRLSFALDTAPHERVWLSLHLGFILSGLAGFVTSFAGAVMYLWQSAQLKSRRPGKIFLKLPSLETLERMHFRSLLWGALLFSVGVVMGFAWASDMNELSEIVKDPKALLSLVTCFMYWGIIGVRLSAWRRGRKIAAGALAVFLILFFTVASSYVFPGAFHKGLS